MSAFQEAKGALAVLVLLNVVFVNAPAENNQQQQPQGLLENKVGSHTGARQTYRRQNRHCAVSDRGESLGLAEPGRNGKRAQGGIQGEKEGKTLKAQNINGLRSKLRTSGAGCGNGGAIAVWKVLAC